MSGRGRDSRAIFTIAIIAASLMPTLLLRTPKADAAAAAPTSTAAPTTFTAATTRRGDPAPFIAAALDFASKGNFDQAARNYQRALELDGALPNVWVAYGDALNNITADNPQATVHLVRAAWESALALDPHHKPAAQRLLAFWKDVISLDPSRPEAFERLAHYAQLLHAIDLSDPEPQIMEQTAVIRPWLASAPAAPGAAANPRIEQAIEKLETLHRAHPADADAMLYLALAKVRQADDERRARHDDKSRDLAAQAERTVSDALAANANSAAMFFAAAEVAQAQQKSATAIAPAISPAAATTAPADARDEKLRDIRRRKLQYLKRARDLVAPTDPQYIYICVGAARACDNRAEQNTILREMYRNQPNDQTARLALAEQLGTQPDQKEEAVALLDLPLARGGLTGPKAFLAKEVDIRTTALATTLRLDLLAAARARGATIDPANLAQLREKVNAGLEHLAQLEDADSPHVLRLRGKSLRIDGKNAEAIDCLERAAALYARKPTAVGSSPSDQLDRYEVIDMLARAYIDTGQEPKARPLLNDLVTRFPGFHAARLLLAQLLIRAGAIDEARPHVAILASAMPASPDVIKLQLQLLGPASPREQRLKLYANLPETTAAERMDKTNTAMVIGESDDAVRLVNALLVTAPDDAVVVRLAVRVFHKLNNDARANQILQSALSRHPDDPRLQQLAKSLGAAHQQK